MFNGKRLAAIRIDNDLQQQELAHIIGVETQTISAYETGKTTPSMKILMKIADVLHISLDYLCGLSDDPIYYDKQNYLLLHKNTPPAMKSELQRLAMVFEKYYDCDNLGKRNR